MLTGTIICICGQSFGFTTDEETITCPACGHPFDAAANGTPTNTVRIDDYVKEGEEYESDI